MKIIYYARFKVELINNIEECVKNVRGNVVRTTVVVEKNMLYLRNAYSESTKYFIFKVHISYLCFICIMYTKLNIVLQCSTTNAIKF